MTDLEQVSEEEARKALEDLKQKQALEDSQVDEDGVE